MTWRSPNDGPQDRVRSRDPGAEAAGRADMPVIRSGPDPLPTPRGASVPARPGSTETFIRGIFGDIKRSGPQRVAPSTKVMLVFADALLDLREAEFEAPETEFWILSVGGDVRVIVPPGMEVVVRGSLTLGDQRIDTDAAGGRDGRRLVLNLKGTLGDVKVKAFPVGERVPRRWRWL